MHIDVVTIFPEVFGPVLSSSMLGIAQEQGAVTFAVHDLRQWTSDHIAPPTTTLMVAVLAWS